MNIHNPFDGGCGNQVDTSSRDQLVNDTFGNSYRVVQEVYRSSGMLEDLYKFLLQYGLTTNVAVKSPVEAVVTENTDLFGNKQIEWTGKSGSYSVMGTTGLRVLVIGQDDPSENGIYNVQNLKWTRAVDFTGSMAALNGTLVFSVQGDAWQVRSPTFKVEVGTTSITFDEIDFFAKEAVSIATQKAMEAAASAAAAAESELSAKDSKDSAANSEQIAVNAAADATESKNLAKASEVASAASQAQAKASEVAAANSASLAESKLTNERTFPTTTAGLAGTTNGEYFRVPQGTGSSISFIYYRNDNGTAVVVAELVGKGAITNNIRLYMSMSAAVADLPNIPVGTAAFIRNTASDVIANEYTNVSGTLTATGRRIISDANVNKLMPLLPLADSTIFKTMTELNDEYDYVMLDGQYNMLLGVKGTVFDFSNVSINGAALDPAGILAAPDKTNLTKLSDTTSFNSPGGKYELNPNPYVILSEDFFVLFDLEDYNERSKLWQLGYENSLLPPKVNPYAPFSQVNSAGKSQIRAYDTENKKEIAITNVDSNETNPRPEALDRIVWTSDRNDGAPGGLYYAKAPEFKPYPYISKSKIVGWGHSFMENSRFLNRIAQLTGLYTYNFGRSSLTSEGIASRQGGSRTSYVPSGGVIPESGSVNLSPSIPGPNRAFANGAIASIACSFAGVDGMFGWDGTNATFTRTTPGVAVPVTDPLPIIVYPITGYSVTDGAPSGTRYDQHDECINLIWAGRNNISEVDRILSNVQSMVDYLKPLGKRFVILPEFPSGSEPTGSTNNNYVKTVNSLYKERFPDNYCEINGVDLLDNFMNHHNPAFAGDVEDVTNGVTPRSLRYDSLHPSQSIAGSISPENALYIGADVNAEFVYNFMKLKGWVL